MILVNKSANLRVIETFRCSISMPFDGASRLSGGKRYGAGQRRLSSKSKSRNQFTRDFACMNVSMITFLSRCFLASKSMYIIHIL